MNWKDEKILEVALDSGVRHTRYYSLNKEVSYMGGDRFFEAENGLRPLAVAKKWAKENGYTHLETVRITRGRYKKYTL